jgi:hypothetical protein
LKRRKTKLTDLWIAGDKITAAKLNQLCEKGIDYVIKYNSVTTEYEALDSHTMMKEEHDSDARTVIQYALDDDSTILLCNHTYNLTGVSTASNLLGLQCNEGNKLCGNSKYETILTQAAGTNLNIMLTSTGKGVEDNVTVENLTFDGNYSNQSYAGQSSSAYTSAGISGYGDNWDLRNLIFKNISQYGGIVVHGAYYNIENIYGENIVTPAHAADREKYATLVMLTSNLCHDTTVNGLRGNDVDGCLLLLEDYTYNNTVKNLVLNTGGYGILGIYAEYNEVSGFNFKNATEGIEMSYSSVKNKFANGIINTPTTYGVIATSPSSAYNTFNHIDVWSPGTSGFSLASGTYSKASNCTVDGVSYSYGLPEEKFYSVVGGTEAYDYWKTLTQRINADGEYADINFMAPSNFGALTSLTVHYFAFGAVTDMLFNAASGYRAATQASNTHSSNADITITTEADKLYSSDISSIVPSLAANDVVGINISRPTSGNTNIGVVGVSLKYVTNG